MGDSEKKGRADRTAQSQMWLRVEGEEGICRRSKGVSTKIRTRPSGKTHSKAEEGELFHLDRKSATGRGLRGDPKKDFLKAV